MSGEAEGFGVIPNWVVRETELSAYALLVYVAISGRANRSGECWPSMALLAKEARCSESSVHRAVRELKAAGLVAVRTQANGGRQTTNIYRLLSPVSEAPLDRGVSEGQGGGVSETPSGVSVRHPEEDTEEETTSKKTPAEYLVIADLLAQNVENVTGKRPEISDAWLRDIRLLCTRDGYTIPQVIWVANWLVQDTRFWYSVTLSPAKFRKNFGAIVGEARRPSASVSKAQSKEEELARSIQEMDERARVAERRAGGFDTVPALELERAKR